MMNLKRYQAHNVQGAHFFFIFFFFSPDGFCFLLFSTYIAIYMKLKVGPQSITVRFQVLLYKKKNNVISKIFILMALLHT